MRLRNTYISARAKDPTSTTVLRSAYVSQFRRRFSYIASLSTESIVKNDCFGLREQEAIAAKVTFTDSVRGFPPQQPIPENTFEFSTNSEKTRGFLEWLNRAQDNVIFEPARNMSTVEKIWQDLYIKTSYAHGIKWARGNLKRDREVFMEIDPLYRSELGTDDDSVRAKLNGPVSIDNLESMYIRAFAALEGITADMDAEISRILANGLSAGWNPNRIAREINSAISTIGIYRATLLARTEIIRAHHVASIQEYKDAGVEGVMVFAEWTTARDSRVCPRCAALDFNRTGKLWTLDEILPLIPLHPQCRCAALPAAKFTEV